MVTFTSIVAYKFSHVCFHVIVTCYAQSYFMNRITTKIEMGNIQHEITLSLDAVWLAYMLYELIRRTESMYSFLLSKCCPVECSKLPPSSLNCNIVICTLLPIVPWDQLSWLVLSRVLGNTCSHCCEVTRRFITLNFQQILNENRHQNIQYYSWETDPDELKTFQ